MINLQDLIEKITAKQNLSRAESEQAFLTLLQGQATQAQISSLLIGLNIKGETIEEIAGAASVMREKAEKFKAPENVLDTCGTGGDGLGTFNISTAVAFVVAGAGVPVAKHGNKAASSRSGSADILRELGVNIDADKSVMEKALLDANICFMMAPKYHSAMHNVAAVRQQLGIRTIFNILGPLANPAGAQYQLIGVYARDLLVKLATVLSMLGSKRAWVVHGEDGLDEITTTGVTHVAQLSDGKVSTFTINPADYGIKIARPSDLQGGDAAHNANELKELFLGHGKTAYRDIVLLNSAAALVVCGKATNLNEGLSIAKKSIDNGNANNALLKLIQISNR